MTRRRGWTRLALFVAFIVVPLVEIYVLIQVGQVIGPWWTILLLILPFTRPAARRMLTQLVSKRLLAGYTTRPGPGPGGPVVRGEVVEE